MFILTSKTNFMFLKGTRGCQQADVIIEFVTAPVLLSESVFM